MGWVVIPKQLEGAPDAGLSRSDFDVLCDPQGWLTDALINYAVITMGREEDEALGDFRSGVLFLKPALVKLAKDGDAEAFRNSLGDKDALGNTRMLDQVDKLPRDAAVILFPILRDEKHWSLLAFYKQGRAFVHFDSLRDSNEAEAKKLIERLTQMSYLATRRPFSSPPELRPQHDGYNCGLYVASFARLHLQLGRALTGAEIAGVTSDTCDALREQMLRSLQPRVARELPHPGMPPLLKSDETRQQERAELRKAVQTVQKQIKKENEKPVELGGIDPCPLAAPATVAVTVTSRYPGARPIESARVVFAVGKDNLVRSAVRDPVATTAWKAEASLAPPSKDAPLKVKVTAYIQPEEEFEPGELSRVVSVKPGESEEVKLTAMPKPERRLYARLLVDDAAEGKQRPIPAGLKVEFVFDGGASQAAATVQRDGTCLGDDNRAGVRVPRSAGSLCVRFPAADRARRVVWRLGSPAGGDAQGGADTLFGEAGGSRPGFDLPAQAWEMNPGDWLLPAQHESRRRLDLSRAGALGTHEAPLSYVMVRSPVPKTMNGHAIEHVVVLMLENRGFDHFMGYLYEGATQPKNRYPKDPKGRHAQLRGFEGLDGLSPEVTRCEYHYTYRRDLLSSPFDSAPLSSARGHGRDCRTMTHRERKNIVDSIVDMEIKDVLQPRRGTRASNVPSTNPHEDFVHILQDMYGREVIADPYDMEDPEVREKRLKGPDGKYIAPKMNGWPQNYCDGILHHHDDPCMVLRKEHVSEILDMYLPDQLPVMSGLARNYAVSDLWFCSVPSQTNTNRAFWIVGSAAGLVTNDWDPVLKRMDKVKHFAADRLPEGLNRSLFDVLEENQVDWGYYWSMKWPPLGPNGSCYLTNMCPRFLDAKYKDNLRTIEDFFRDLKQDKLKTVTYLEPYWGGGGFWFTSDGTKRGVGNEFHPVQDVFNGEFFVKRVYDALAKSGKWESTLLVITFDENGGTYDHFPPWPATPPGREPEKDGKLATQFGFKFDCYGVRVPTLLISSHIKPQTLFRSDTEVPFDHTSIIATILKWQQIDPQSWKLGNRVANAPTFDRVLDNPSDPEDPRRFAATGMGLLDGSRNARKGKTTLKLGDRFKLKYVGNKWAKEPPVGGYLGGPKNWANWWYAVCANADHPEMKLQFVGEPGQEVKVGMPMAIRVASGKAEGRTLAVAELIKASTVYLYDGKNPSLWIPWPVNDRCEGVPLCPGDEIYLLSERYLPERLAQFMTASATGGESGQTSGTWYDPYQRLCLDPFDPKHPKAVRYARWRAGEWDIWRIET
jgi:phospholipase C